MSKLSLISTSPTKYFTIIYIYKIIISFFILFLFYFFFFFFLIIPVNPIDRIFGGSQANEARDDSGWKEYGQETVGPIVGRAILLDVAAQKGVECLADGYEITVEDVQQALEVAGQTTAPPLMRRCLSSAAFTCLKI